MSLNYLIIQRYFFLLSIFSILYAPALLTLSFIMKLGLPPFHLWFVRIARVIQKYIFLFMITLHKLLPIIFLGKTFSNLIRTFFFSSTLFLTGFILVTRRTIFYTLVLSSIVHGVWIILSVLLRKGIVLFYWAFYRILLTTLVRLFLPPLVKQSNLSQNILSSKCWLLISGIPPFIIFWFKVYLLNWIIFNLGFLMRLIIILVRVLALTAYYRTWHLGGLLENNLIFLKTLGPISMILLFWVLFFK